MRQFCTDWDLQQLMEEHEKLPWEWHSTSLLSNKENDLLEQIITNNESWIHFYEPETKLASMVWEKKGARRKFKNERSPGQVMLMVFWDCHSLVYVEFGPEASEEKRNVTQETYSLTLMHSRNEIWSKRWGLPNQKVILIHDNAHPHTVQPIQTRPKDSHWEYLQ